MSIPKTIKVWKPVEKYHCQESYRVQEGGRHYVELTVQDGIFTVRDSKGQEITAILRPGYTICRMEEVIPNRVGRLVQDEWADEDDGDGEDIPDNILMGDGSGDSGERWGNN